MFQTRQYFAGFFLSCVLCRNMLPPSLYRVRQTQLTVNIQCDLFVRWTWLQSGDCIKNKVRLFVMCYSKRAESTSMTGGVFTLSDSHRRGRGGGWICNFCRNSWVVTCYCKTLIPGNIYCNFLCFVEQCSADIVVSDCGLDDRGSISDKGSEFFH
jgi:hypothetical protein